MIAYEELFVYLHRSVRHNTTSHSVGAKVPAREGSPSGKLVLRRLGQTFSATIACGAFLVFYDSKCCDAVLNLHGRLHANPYHSPIWGRQIDHRKTEEHRGIHPVLYYCAWFQNAQKKPPRLRLFDGARIKNDLRGLSTLSEFPVTIPMQM